MRPSPVHLPPLLPPPQLLNNALIKNITTKTPKQPRLLLMHPGPSFFISAPVCFRSATDKNLLSGRSAFSLEMFRHIEQWQVGKFNFLGHGESLLNGFGQRNRRRNVGLLGGFVATPQASQSILRPVARSTCASRGQRTRASQTRLHPPGQHRPATHAVPCPSAWPDECASCCPCGYQASL